MDDEQNVPLKQADLEDHFNEVHDQQPQVLWKVTNAVRQIFDGLGTLAAHGYTFALQKMDPAATKPLEFPKMMYRMRSDGLSEDMVADDADHADALAAEGFSEVHPNAPQAAPPVAAVATDAEGVGEDEGAEGAAGGSNG